MSVFGDNASQFRPRNTIDPHSEELDMNDRKIVNLQAGTSSTDVVNKGQMDTAIATVVAAYLPLAGGTMSGDIDMDDNDITNATNVYASEIRMKGSDLYLSNNASTYKLRLTPSGSNMIWQLQGSADSFMWTKGSTADYAMKLSPSIYTFQLGKYNDGSTSIDTFKVVSDIGTTETIGMFDSKAIWQYDYNTGAQLSLESDNQIGFYVGDNTEGNYKVMVNSSGLDLNGNDIDMQGGDINNVQNIDCNGSDMYFSFNGTPKMRLTNVSNDIYLQNDQSANFRFTGAAGANQAMIVNVDSTPKVTMFDNAEVIATANDGNPSLYVGRDTTNNYLQIQCQYDTGTQVCRQINFNSQTSSGTADYAEMVFNIDGTQRMKIKDSGVVVEGILDCDSNEVYNVATPTLSTSGANKSYVDGHSHTTSHATAAFYQSFITPGTNQASYDQYMVLDESNCAGSADHTFKIEVSARFTNDTNKSTSFNDCTVTIYQYYSSAWSGQNIAYGQVIAANSQKQYADVSCTTFLSGLYTKTVGGTNKPEFKVTFAASAQNSTEYIDLEAYSIQVTEYINADGTPPTTLHGSGIGSVHNWSTEQ